MNRNLIIVSWIVSTTLASTSIAGNGVFVVSQTEGKIYWIGADRSGPNVVHTSLSPLPEGVAFDSQGTGALYWSKGPIYRAMADGGDETLVATGIGRGPMAIDPDHQALYISEMTECDGSNSSNRGLKRFDLAGSGSLMIDAGADCGEGVAVDPAGGKIYWANHYHPNSPGIFRANLDGSNKENFIPSPDSGVYPGLDVAAGHIYWAMNWEKEIRRANLSDGGQMETLLTFGNPGASVDIAGLVVDPDGGFIYWIQNTGTIQSLRRAHLDGSGMEVLWGVSASSFLSGIALDNRTPFCTRTAMFADITNLQGSVEFGDVSAVVDAFRGQSLIDPTLCDLYPCDLGGRRCMGDGIIDFRDVSQSVDAFRNVYLNCPE